RELLKLWAEEASEQEDKKKYHTEEPSREEFMKWLQKMMAEKQPQAKKPLKKDELLYYDFLTLQVGK
ncbi:MAG: hypothetical protein P8107_15290, partial [Spirochaetia bacterium]